MWPLAVCSSSAMLLAPNRSNPPRYRERELHPSIQLNSEFKYWNPDKNEYERVTQMTNTVPAGYEYMYDNGSRVAGSKKHPWKDCQHMKSTYEYTAHDFNKTHCDVDCITGDSPRTTTDWYFPANPLNQVQDILNHSRVQHGLATCLRRWHDGLYDFNAAALPDVSVILMEDLPHLSGNLVVIVELAHKLANYIRVLTDLRFELDRRLLKKSNYIQIKRIKEEIKSYGKLYLGIEFALKQSVRSATELIAGIAGGAHALRYDERQVTSHREIVKFHTWGTDTTLCPPWEGERTAQTFETVEVHWCITTNSTLTLRGSQLEQTLAKLMAKAGVLPSLASIWEATPFSWLIDYVFRTGLLLRYVERANNIGFSNLDVMDLALSVFIKRQTQRYAGAHYPTPGITTHDFEFYERCVAPDLAFPAVLQWLKLPHGDQWAKAVAFFTSKFL